MDADEAKAARKAPERALHTGHVGLCLRRHNLGVTAGRLGGTFIPLASASRRHPGMAVSEPANSDMGMYVGAMTLGGIMIWLTYNWPRSIAISAEREER